MLCVWCVVGCILCVVCCALCVVGYWLPWPGTAYAVPQYPAVPDLFFVAPTGVGAGLHKMCRSGRSGQRTCADEDVLMAGGSGACGGHITKNSTKTATTK